MSVVPLPVAGFGWRMAYALYGGVLAPALLGLGGPLYLARYRLRGLRLPDVRQRLGRLPRELTELADQGPIWIHAVSVGEVRTARPLVAALSQAYPARPLVLSTVTPSGQEAAAALPGLAAVFYLPFDVPSIVRSVLRQLRPAMLIVLETELWPALLRETARAGVALALVNARISDRTWPRYRRCRALLQPLLAGARVVAARGVTDAERLAACGAPEQALFVAGNLKYDALPSPPAPEQLDALRADYRLEADEPVCVAGSTFAGEEALIAAAWRAACPAGRLIVAPRHLHRVDAAVRALGHGAQRVSQLAFLPASERPPALVLDSMGRLTAVYALADVAVIGKSWLHDGGQNPLEPANCGVPVVFGPKMSNFAEEAAMLEQAGGGIRASGETLPHVLSDLIHDPDRRRAMGEAARRAVAARQGVTTSVVKAIKSVLSD